MPVSCFLDAQLCYLDAQKKLCAFVSDSIHVCPDDRPENLKNQDPSAERSSVANTSMDEMTGQFLILPFPSLKA